MISLRWQKVSLTVKRGYMQKDVKLRLDADDLDGELVQIAVGSIKALPAINHTAIDVTEIIEYSNKIKEIGRGFNKMTAPLFIRDFSVAYDITSNLFFEATKKDMKASAALEMAESIAYLENAGDYLKTKGIKDTADARKRYIPLDPGVIQAQDLKAETAAVLAFLKCKLQEFRSAIECVKKIAYGDNFMSPDEGM